MDGHDEDHQLSISDFSLGGSYGHGSICGPGCYAFRGIKHTSKDRHVLPQPCAVFAGGSIGFDTTVLYTKGSDFYRNGPLCRIESYGLLGMGACFCVSIPDDSHSAYFK